MHDEIFLSVIIIRKSVRMQEDGNHIGMKERGIISQCFASKSVKWRKCGFLQKPYCQVISRLLELTSPANRNEKRRETIYPQGKTENRGRELDSSISDSQTDPFT